MKQAEIQIRGARQHNLKNVDLSIPRNQMVVITGVSGSGKSSLAVDTLFAEGQRRYVESLSAYARQFVGQLDRPDVDSIDGLSPTIAIDQRSLGRNPRSTVGTATELYDLLRVLYARVGRPHCPSCGREIAAVQLQEVKSHLLGLAQGTRLWLFAPLVRDEKGPHGRLLQRLAREGYLRVRVDGRIYELTEEIQLDSESPHSIDVLVDRLEIKPDTATRLADSLETTARLSGGVLLVEPQGDAPLWFCERPFCVSCGIQMPELTPKLFSFNDPKGACPSCRGLGYQSEFDPELVVPDLRKSIRDGAVAPWAYQSPRTLMEELNSLGRHMGFDLDTPFQALPEKAKHTLLYGSGPSKKASKRTGRARESDGAADFEGIIPWLKRNLEKAPDSAARDVLEAFMSPRPCSDCRGSRLRVEARSVRVGSWTLEDLCSLSVSDLKAALSAMRFESTEREISQRIIETMVYRLRFMEELGLQYLTLNRSSETLSGGESQRIRLATQMGSRLIGITFVLDEPSIGLHPKDLGALLELLRKLRDSGNTLIIVEHDHDTILSADFVVDMGPGAGDLGGTVIYAGPPEGLVECSESVTGAYLSDRKRIPLPQHRRSAAGGFMEIMGAGEHNLKSINVRFPLGCFNCVTGVSGSGKSTLVVDTLFKAASKMLHRGHSRVGKFREIRGLEALDKVIDLDQSPIGRTPRSNPATYTGVFKLVRELFAQMPESRMRGYRAGRYSFNVKGGRCEVCQGDGVRRVEMHFLPDVYATCEVCGGTRYNGETLEIRFKGLNVAQVLNLTVNEAWELFENQPKIRQILQTLQAVGLGYIRLGQAATTLSGGEAQRIKLARELSRTYTGRTLYILDEPTTGLHFEDIHKLMQVLQRLVDAGNTVVVIEHNLDVIKCADYVIDLGPGGGDAGGWVVACGIPEEVARTESSITGKYLKAILHRAGRYEPLNEKGGV